MINDIVNYKGISVKKELYPIIKHIEDVDKYKEELGRLSTSWDMFALLGQLGDINIDIGKTKENFLNLTSTLLNHLSEQQIKKVTQEMKFKAQVAIDILIRNLFERTADIGFLATDDDIRNFIQNYVSKYNENSVILRDNIQKRFKEYVSKYSVYFDIVVLDNHGKLPDVVIYDSENNWLFLIEAVTSHGPVDHKRYGELTSLFQNCTAGLVFVSAFPNTKTYVKYSGVIAWETEVWMADNPSHMIHFNGSRFMGPY